MTVYVYDKATGKVVPKGAQTRSEAPRGHAKANEEFVDHTLPRRRDDVAMRHCRCQAKGNPDREAHHKECQFYRMTKLTSLYRHADRFGRPVFGSRREVDEFVAEARDKDPEAAEMVYDRKGNESY